MTEFTRKNLGLLFPSVKQPSCKVLSPGESDTAAAGAAAVRPASDPDYSWTAAKCILALLQAIVQAADFRYSRAMCTSLK